MVPATRRAAQRGRQAATNKCATRAIQAVLWVCRVHEEAVAAAMDSELFDRSAQILQRLSSLKFESKFQELFPQNERDMDISNEESALN